MTRDLETVEYTDERYPAKDSRRLERLLEMRAIDDFQDMVGAAIAGQPIDRLNPVFLLAVDSMRGAQRLRTFELMVVARDHDHLGTVGSSRSPSRTDRSISSRKAMILR